MRTDRTVDVWGERTAYEAATAWPSRVDTFLRDGLSEDDVEEWVSSACQSARRQIRASGRRVCRRSGGVSLSRIAWHSTALPGLS
jgi:hypothetical protein